jgi:hypothetical protein
MGSSKVYIPQEPMRKALNGEWVSKGLDLASAQKFGDVQIIWPPSASILYRSLIEERAQRVADMYNDKTDFVVALGSPTLIGALCWAIGQKGKELRILEWDKGMRMYYPTMSSELKGD